MAHATNSRVWALAQPILQRYEQAKIEFLEIQTETLSKLRALLDDGSDGDSESVCHDSASDTSILSTAIHSLTVESRFAFLDFSRNFLTTTEN